VLSSWFWEPWLEGDDEFWEASRGAPGVPCTSLTPESCGSWGHRGCSGACGEARRVDKCGVPGVHGAWRGGGGDSAGGMGRRWPAVGSEGRAPWASRGGDGGRGAGAGVEEEESESRFLDEIEGLAGIGSGNGSADKNRWRVDDWLVDWPPGSGGGAMFVK
jgi:hypothetical protein